MIDPVLKQQQLAHHEFERCKYPSKICRNIRTRKRNGQLHRFCEEHRNKANLNQKRWSASRQRRWDALAEQYALGHEEPQDPAQRNPTNPAPITLPMLSLDDYDYEGDLDYDLDTLVVGADPSWQETDDLHDILGDLLHALATEDAPASSQLPSHTTAWQPLWL